MINDQIHGMQTADPSKMRCKDCLFRDKTVIKLNGREIPVGVMKDTCMMFNKPGHWKPTDIVLRNADCLLYERDEEA